MATFKEANQARLQLKMNLSVYFWYVNSSVTNESDGYSVAVAVNQIDNKVRKIVPQVLNDVSIKLELA